MAKAQKSKKANNINVTKQPGANQVCFVIMPFGGWFDSYYTEIYCPAIKKVGLIPRRADDLYRPSNIVQDIWDLTKKAKIILADLTNKNANVFYELGLAHALAKPAILITETIDDIPFDLRSLRIIEYDKNESNWGSSLQIRIENALKETLMSPNETIPTAFLETKGANVETPQVTIHEKDILELKQELELIKRQVIRPQNFPPKSLNKEVVTQQVLSMLNSGKSRSEIINMIVSEFNFSHSSASRILTQTKERINEENEVKARIRQELGLKDY